MPQRLLYCGGHPAAALLLPGAPLDAGAADSGAVACEWWACVRCSPTAAQLPDMHIRHVGGKHPSTSGSTCSGVVT